MNISDEILRQTIAGLDGFAMTVSKGNYPKITLFIIIYPYFRLLSYGKFTQIHGYLMSHFGVLKYHL